MRDNLPNIGDTVWVDNCGHPYKALILFVSEEHMKAIVQSFGFLKRKRTVDIDYIMGVISSREDAIINEVLKEQKRYG